MAMNDYIVSSRQLEAPCSTATRVLMSASSIFRRLVTLDCVQGCFYTLSPTAGLLRTLPIAVSTGPQ